jgi:hypothetical protein
MERVERRLMSMTFKRSIQIGIRERAPYWYLKLALERIIRSGNRKERLSSLSISRLISTCSPWLPPWTSGGKVWRPSTAFSQVALSIRTLAMDLQREGRCRFVDQDQFYLISYSHLRALRFLLSLGDSALSVNYSAGFSASGSRKIFGTTKRSSLHRIRIHTASFSSSLKVGFMSIRNRWCTLYWDILWAYPNL